jgi:hypothetical protein
VRRANIQRYELWIGLWVTESGPVKERPIWVQMLRNDEQMWERLKDEFSDAFILEPEEYWAIGLTWPLSADANIEQVRGAGQDLTNRITRVLIPN